MTSPYQRTGGTLVEPWANYVAAMQAVAGIDAHAYFIDMADRMPYLDPDTYALKPDGIHPGDRLSGFLGEVLAEELMAL